MHEITHFCTKLQSNCTALDQSESSNFYLSHSRSHSSSRSRPRFRFLSHSRSSSSRPLSRPRSGSRSCS